MTTAADAHPEKRLFVSLLTRDISLIDAILDLIDNSINAAITSTGVQLDKAADYQSLAGSPIDAEQRKIIQIAFRRDSFSLEDNCGGISFEQAKNSVFVFGRNGLDTTPTQDRLSVYGIGLKRALFKLGNDIEMRSNHSAGGFETRLNVDAWQAEPSKEWTIPKVRRFLVNEPVHRVSELHEHRAQR